MFEDQVKNQTEPPKNLPVEPEDILAGVEKENVSGAPTPAVNAPPNALGVGLLKKKEPVVLEREIAPTEASASTAADQMPMYAMKAPVLGKIILFVILAVLLVGIGGGGWWLYKRLSKPPENVPTSGAVPENPENGAIQEEKAPVSAPAVTNENVSAEMKTDQILFGEQVDSDKDGLDDIRERELGTNPYSSDTDEDGLGDSDEAIIWKTNPLNSDTDGDGYLDGEEVSHGYSPLGAGKLLEIPPGASTSTATGT